MICCCLVVQSLLNSNFWIVDHALYRNCYNLFLMSFLLRNIMKTRYFSFIFHKLLLSSRNTFKIVNTFFSMDFTFFILYGFRNLAYHIQRRTVLVQYVTRNTILVKVLVKFYTIARA